MLFQFSDENATYILEPITNEVVYNDDPNIMWIQVTTGCFFSLDSVRGL